MVQVDAQEVQYYASNLFISKIFQRAVTVVAGVDLWLKSAA